MADAKIFCKYLSVIVLYVQSYANIVMLYFANSQEYDLKCFLKYFYKHNTKQTIDRRERENKTVVMI